MCIERAAVYAARASEFAAWKKSAAPASRADEPTLRLQPSSSEAALGPVLDPCPSAKSRSLAKTVKHIEAVPAKPAKKKRSKEPKAKGWVLK